jgi:hypothetical protein
VATTSTSSVCHFRHGMFNKELQLYSVYCNILVNIDEGTFDDIC